MSPRRMPTKAELLRLQKLYRTDKRIAEMLGNGVTEHLVAYWRRKKGVAVYSSPKFSEKEIREVWDRFGDDFHAGMELGISKAAFYNWRRRYKISKKPEALKLEQLTFELYTDEKKSNRQIGSGRMTIFQKLVAQKLDKRDIKVGEEYEFEPDLAIVDGDVSEIITRFRDSGTTYIKNPARLIIAIAAAANSNRSEAAEIRRRLREFGRFQQIANFYNEDEGDCLQLALENGLILPGQIIVGSSQSAAAAGAVGALALVVDADAMVGLWNTGQINLKILPAVRIFINGRAPRGVFARDIGHNLMAQLDSKRIKGQIIEFYGSAIDQMTISERFTLCSTIISSGAVSAICPFDATTRRFVGPRARKQFTPVLADRNATYAGEFSFDVNTMKPAAYIDIENTTAPLEELTAVPVQHVFLGGAVNGRYDDLKIAADLLKSKKISADTRLYIQPASREVYLKAVRKGLIRVFIEAGASILFPGLIPGEGEYPVLGEGEVGLSTFAIGQFAAGNGNLYNVSPATATVSALNGQITNPAEYLKI